MDNRLPPAIQQALRPFMPLTESERQSVDMEVARWKGVKHVLNDARALWLQQAQQQRDNWSATV